MAAAGPELDDAYWRRRNSLLVRRRLVLIWLPSAIVLTFFANKVNLLPMIGVLLWVLGGVLIARWLSAACRTCGDAFFRRAWYSNGFTSRCLNCGHALS